MSFKTLFTIICSALLILLALISGVYADGHCDFADEAIRLGGIAPLVPTGRDGSRSNHRLGYAAGGGGYQR